jgi:hypothetical protein
MMSRCFACAARAVSFSPISAPFSYDAAQHQSGQLRAETSCEYEIRQPSRPVTHSRAGDNAIAGSDCGFRTWVGQAAVADPDVVWAKLAAMA